MEIMKDINSNSTIYNMSCNDGLFTKKKDELVKIVKQFNKDIAVSKLNKSKLLCLILELTEKAQPKPSQKVEPKPQPKPSQKVEPYVEPLNVNDFKKTKWLSSAIGQYYYNKKIKIPYTNKMSGDDLRKILIDRKTNLIELAEKYIYFIEEDIKSYEEIAKSKNDKQQASMAKKVKKELDEFISRVGIKGMKQIEEMRKAEKEEYKKIFEAQMTPQKIKQLEEAKQQAFSQKRFEENQKSLGKYKYSNDLKDMVKRFIRNEYKINGGTKEHKEMENEFKQGLLSLPEGDYKEEMKDFIAYNLEEMYSEDGRQISKSLFNFLRDFAKEYIEED